MGMGMGNGIGKWEWEWKLRVPPVAGDDSIISQAIVKVQPIVPKLRTK